MKLKLNTISKIAPALFILLSPNLSLANTDCPDFGDLTKLIEGSWVGSGTTTSPRHDRIKQIDVVGENTLDGNSVLFHSEFTETDDSIPPNITEYARDYWLRLGSAGCIDGILQLEFVSGDDSSGAASSTGTYDGQILLSEQNMGGGYLFSSETILTLDTSEYYGVFSQNGQSLQETRISYLRR